MFTGIIVDVGQVVEVQKKQDSLTVSILTSLTSDNLNLGASVACNGVCLTVTKLREVGSFREFFVDVGHQTLALTNFKNIKEGDKLNLEPALRMGDQFGGHMLSGHVDELGRVLEWSQSADGFWNFWIEISEKNKNYLVDQGSIAVRGASLTLAEVIDNKFRIMIIPHTIENTNFLDLKKDSLVEIEFDQNVKNIFSILKKMNFIQ